MTEPTTPDLTAVGEVLNRLSRDFAELAELVTGNVPGTRDLAARQSAALLAFPDAPELGLGKAEASLVFRKNGLNPRSIGAFVYHGYLARDGDRRWLTPRGRAHAELFQEET